MKKLIALVLVLVFLLSLVGCSDAKEETVMFNGQTFDKADLSQETIEWLKWYNGLTEAEQLAVDYIPADLNNNLSETSAFFVAKVTEINEGYLLVEVSDNGSTSLGEGTIVHVSTNFDGYTECAVGDSIRIEFDSVIQELYPPIIPNVVAISKNQ